MIVCFYGFDFVREMILIYERKRWISMVERTKSNVRKNKFCLKNSWILWNCCILNYCAFCGNESSIFVECLITKLMKKFIFWPDIYFWKKVMQYFSPNNIHLAAYLRLNKKAFFWRKKKWNFGCDVVTNFVLSSFRNSYSNFENRRTYKFTLKWSILRCSDENCL